MKQKRYWLRGGISGLIVGLFIVLARAAISLMWIDDAGKSSFLSTDSRFLTGELLNVVELLVVGLILGWLYGKIKDRNKA